MRPARLRGDKDRVACRIIDPHGQVTVVRVWQGRPYLQMDHRPRRYPAPGTLYEPIRDLSNVFLDDIHEDRVPTFCDKGELEFPRFSGHL